MDPINNNLHYDFVNNVAETDWIILRDMLWVLYFWNKCDKGVINLYWGD